MALFQSKGRKLMILLSALAWVAISASSASADPPGLSAQETAAPAPIDRMVCRNDRRANSRIPKKVCRKKSEWDRIARESQDAFNDVQNRPTIVIGNGD